MRCSNCGHNDNRSGISYCSRCSSPLSRGRGGRSLQSRSPRLTQAPVPVRQAPLAIQNGFDVSNFPAVLQRVYWENYQAQEMLNRGNPFWGLIGKHKAAYVALEKTKEYAAIQEDLQKQAFVRYQQQSIDHELARRQAEMASAILQEELQRRMEMAAGMMVQVETLFSSEPMTSLPDEAKAELIAKFLHHAEQWIFSYNLPSAPDTPGTLLNDGPTVIDADEF